MKPIVAALLIAGLAGCATPPPQIEERTDARVLETRLVPVGQPRRLPDAEAGQGAIRETSPGQDMARVEEALKARVPEGSAVDIMMLGSNIDGWRCGRVRFANPGGAFVLFAVRLSHDPVETLLGRDAASLEQVRTVCSH